MKKPAIGLVNIDLEGNITFHPDIIAFGDGRSGWLTATLPDWQGAMFYTRGDCFGGNDRWWGCIGDAICDAIERGEIPTRPMGEMPDRPMRTIPS